MYFLAWLAALGTMAALDVAWVVLNTRYGLYKGRMVAGRSKTFVAVAWLLMLAAEAGLVTFMISCVSSMPAAALVGALAGLTVYLVFNGTTLVMDATWPISTALLDTCWGTCLLAVGAIVSFVVA
jgi:uncharacterized membrane protein